MKSNFWMWLDIGYSLTCSQACSGLSKALQNDKLAIFQEQVQLPEGSDKDRPQAHWDIYKSSVTKFIFCLWINIPRNWSRYFKWRWFSMAVYQLFKEKNETFHFMKYFGIAFINYIFISKVCQNDIGNI